MEDEESLPVALPHPLPVPFQQRFKAITGQIQKIKNLRTTPWVCVIKVLKRIMNITSEVTRRDVATLHGATIHLQSA